MAEIDCLVIGAGFAGCYQLHLLRKAGFTVRVVEAASEIGGVWAWNRYPGARVDMEMPYYGYSDPKIWSNWTWENRYPSAQELLQYFSHVDKMWDLSKNIDLGVTITSATFEPDTAGGNPQWVCKTAKGDTYKSRYLVCGTGTSFKSHVPKFEGLETYKGVAHHSADWPRDLDMTGKRVAVIGAGATAVQVMQEAAKVASKVTEFIKSPNIALPIRQRKVSLEEIYAYKPTFKSSFEQCRGARAGLLVPESPWKTFEVTDEEREARWEEMWATGGFYWFGGSFADVVIDEKANRAAYDFWARKTRLRMKDPKKRDLLAPLEMPYFVGSKRPSLEMDYYEMCDKDNVEITNSPILRFTETGITTEEKTEEFDIVAICTGYDAITGGLMTMNIKGVGGEYLHDKWRDGVATYLGLMSHNFPNMFMMYGPQAPTSLTNGPIFLELECEWVRDVLVKMKEEGKATVNPKQSKEAEWCATIDAIGNFVVTSKIDSWYNGGNIPGKKREHLLYWGGIPSWHASCRESLQDWQGFDVSSS